MRVDVDLLLTSQDLFEATVRQYSGCESYQRVEENVFQAGGLRFRILVSGEDKDAVETGEYLSGVQEMEDLDRLSG